MDYGKFLPLLTSLSILVFSFRVKYFIIFIFVLGIGPIQAQEVRSYAGEFLQLGAGARSLALGGTGVAVIDDASGAYWNPASISQLQYPSLSGMHEARFDNTVVYDFAAFAAPLNEQYSIAVTALHIGISGIKDTRSALIDRNENGIFDNDDYLDYSRVTSFGNYDWAFIGTLAKIHDSLLSYGVNAKCILRKLDPENTAFGFGIDVGLRYKIQNDLTIGAAVKDLTTTYLAYSSGAKELIAPMLTVGAAYEWNVFSSESHRLIPVCDIDIRFENRKTASLISAGPMSLDVHSGLEYRFRDLVMLRAGYNDVKMMTFGAGVRLPKLAVDYSFVSFGKEDQLGNIHRVSFSLTIEQEKWRR